jgi:hypothetical protein
MKVLKIFFIMHIFFILLSANSLFDSISEVIEETKNSAGEYGSKAWDLTKKYSNQGKNIVIEESLLKGLNAMVDTNHIKVKIFDIDDETNAIKIIVFLHGEKVDLKVDIKEFEWSVSKDKKNIVFDKLEIAFNIPWIEYLFKELKKQNDGKLVIPYSLATSSLLYTLKPDISPTYTVKKQEPFDFLQYRFDKKYFDMRVFRVKNYTIKGFIRVLNEKNKMEDLEFYIHDYDLHTANNKKYIILNNIDFKSTNKPWIKSIVDNQNKTIQLDFTWNMYLRFGGKRD